MARVTWMGAFGISAGALLILAAAACSLAFDAGALSQGSAPPKDGGQDGSGPGLEGGAAACPGTQGPPSVRVGNGAGVSFCIDATEVTIDQYRLFVQAKNGDTSGQPPECAFNTNYAPQLEDGSPVPGGVAGDSPVTYVDWCDAFAYCAWANKRLCGRVGGGHAPAATPGDPAQSQWMFACSHGGARAYAYGAAFDTSACNDGAEGVVEIAPVKSFPGCVGGFEGIFDMSGNAGEWEDACNASGNCLTRGGSSWDFREPQRDRFACGIPYSSAGDPRTSRYADVGFRCCAD
ncbi:formylglycine-generating enzyme family protein [Pendulispora brunnea]|uniref:Formylglycine-generating enzyme family protein n=1 Tax=Pendulispora brunnea TaxID=2905690 RepID=A0ABZ2KNT6_9BACT